METLKIKDLKRAIEILERKYGKEKAAEIPVLLGDDEELNGFHPALYAQGISDKDSDYELYKDVDYSEILNELSFLIS